MKAFQLTAPRTLEQVDIPEPQIEDGEVKIKVDTLSVCGSDIILEWGPDLPEEEYPTAPGAHAKLLEWLNIWCRHRTGSSKSQIGGQPMSG